MPVVNGREYRSFGISPLQEDKGFIVEGYATTFNDPYDMGMGYSEVIDRNALVGADLSDVIFQLNHDGIVMARLRNNTLQLSCDEHGLYVRADLGGNQEGRNLYESIKNGLIDRMSWGFTVPDEGWQYDANTRTSTITKVDKVYDVSAVSIPANDGTDIHARSYLNGVIERDMQELHEREEERERLELLLEII